MLTSDNSTLINAIDATQPIITYEKEKAKHQSLTPSNFANIDCKSFDSPIGGITNLASNLFALLKLFDKDSKEYKEIWKRIKLLRYFQGCAINLSVAA